MVAAWLLTPEEIRALQPPLVLREMWMYHPSLQQGQPSPVAGWCLVRSQGTGYSLFLPGRGWGSVCCLEIVFYLIYSSSLACFLSVFSNFYKIKLCFFIKMLLKHVVMGLSTLENVDEKLLQDLPSGFFCVCLKD